MNAEESFDEDVSRLFTKGDDLGWGAPGLGNDFGWAPTPGIA